MHIKNQQLGTTLPELLTALAILGILSAFTVTGFSRIQQQLKMHNGLKDLVHSLHLARQFARSTGEDVTLCKSADGRQCSATADWQDGWLLFSNTDGDNPPFVDPDETLLEVHESVNSLKISANRQAFVMRPFGYRSTNGTLIYCDQRGAAAARALIVSYTGKPRISRLTAAGRDPGCASHG